MINSISIIKSKPQMILFCLCISFISFCMFIVFPPYQVFLFLCGNDDNNFDKDLRNLNNCPNGCNRIHSCFLLCLNHTRLVSSFCCSSSNRMVNIFCSNASCAFSYTSKSLIGCSDSSSAKLVCILS